MLCGFSLQLAAGELDTQQRRGNLRIGLCPGSAQRAQGLVLSLACRDAESRCPSRLPLGLWGGSEVGRVGHAAFLCNPYGYEGVTRVTQDVRPSASLAGLQALLGQDHTRPLAESQRDIFDPIKAMPRWAARGDARSRSCPDADLCLPPRIFRSFRPPMSQSQRWRRRRQHCWARAWPAPSRHFPSIREQQAGAGGQTVL